jgi:signal transduction histidine kinase
MKKKIILGVLSFSLFFLVSGIFIVISIERGISNLDNLIKLHKVELLREHLLIDLRRVQSDIQLKNTRYAKGAAAMVAHARSMDAAMDGCFRCHHSANIHKILWELKENINRYKEAISRVLTIRADVKRLEAEEDVAYRVGNDLVAQVDLIVEIANRKLDEKTDSTLAAIAISKKILFLLLIAGPLGATVSGFFFIRSVTKPVGVLLEATRHVKNADFEYTIQETLKDEFAELATAFNEMTSSINRQYQEMQRAEQLTVYGEMAAGLAHEIKTPLAGIKGAMNLLRKENGITEENREVLESAIGEIKRIESLMKELLQYARPSKPNLMRVDLNEVLKDIIDLLPRYPAFRRGDFGTIEVSTDFAPDLPVLDTDPLQQQQIFLNLFLNAADAMQEGGTLTVGTSYHQREWIEVVVSDTGRGIPPEHMKSIFKPFFTTKPKGTGLGLATTKRLVEQHGGVITVAAQIRGTSFHIRFPLQKEAAGGKTV